VRSPLRNRGSIELESARIAGIPLLRFAGHMDFRNCPEARKALRPWVKRKSRAIIVSLRGVERMDSCAVATLIECVEDMGEYGGKLLLVGINSSITDAFALAGVSDLFEVFEDEEQAAASLDRSRR